MSRSLNETSSSHKLDVKPEAHTFQYSGPLNRVERVDAQLTIGRNIEKKKRTVLSEQDARHIFQNKPPQGRRDRRHADMLASLYGVSVKTIRDVWNGRTWYRSTCHLDPSKVINLHRLQRKRGRPLGAKDSKPRVVIPIRDEVICHPPPPETCLPAAAGIIDVWRPASLASWLDAGSWAVSLGWDDPFRDDWPFWDCKEPEPAQVAGDVRIVVREAQ